uniref:Sulfatase N-terminal domain-containing protein n=2 Tax=Plectus sambesii TaxID=2011161 RepID=A0A914XU05_9BILA
MESDDVCTTDSCDEDRLQKPNIIILLADDMGYGDLSCYGHSSQEWNEIDRMAAEGLRFTQFYSADSMCSPARAGLLTGRLPIRSGIVGGRRVFVDYDKGGLPKEEMTLAEMLKSAGYLTGMTGKWHLGINAVNNSDGTHLPHMHGFDVVGLNLPMSVLWTCDTSGYFQPDGPENSQCFLYRGQKLIQQPIQFQTLTEDMVTDWKSFLDQSQSGKTRQPFFYYFSFPHVHTALWAAKDFKGKSQRGLYGDNLNEMAWAVGQVLDSLKAANIDKETLVLFMSDHGPHKEMCIYGGSTGGLKGGKSNSFEGGFRIPFIAWMPGTVPAGAASPAILSTLDLIPTFHKWILQRNLPENITFDGIDVIDYLLGKRLDPALNISQSRPLFFYCNQHLMAVRYRQYKIHFKTSPYFSDSQVKDDCVEGVPKGDWYVSQLCLLKDLVEQNPPLVYDLHADPREMYSLDVIGNTELHLMVKEVERIVESHKNGIAEVPNQLGKYDPKLIPCCNYPKCECNDK